MVSGLVCGPGSDGGQGWWRPGRGCAFRPSATKAAACAPTFKLVVKAAGREPVSTRGSAARCTGAGQRSGSRPRSRRDRARTTAAWPAGSAVAGHQGAPVAAAEQGDGDGGREVHQQVDVICLAVELAELRAEVRADGCMI